MNNYESFMILLDNLSPFYVFTTIVTIIAIICTFACTKYFSHNRKDKVIENSKQENNLKEIESDEENGEKIDISQGFLSQIRSAKIRKLEESLTDEQIAQERSAEQEQLAAIFKLLKMQESQQGNMELDEIDLKEQLKLYR